MAEQSYINNIVALENAKRDIDNSIERWLYRLAKNNELDIVDARRFLSTSELEEFRWTLKEYIKFGKENEVSQQWVQELLNASAKAHISYLDAIRIETEKRLEMLAFERTKYTADMITGVYRETYLRNIYEVLKVRHPDVQLSLERVDKAELEKIANIPWTEDGRAFSSRIWTDKNKMVNTLHQELLKDIKLGKKPTASVDRLLKFVNEDIDSKKSAVKRVIYCEQAYFSNLATKDALDDLKVEYYEIVATLDSSTSDLCRELDGEVYKMAEYETSITAPPFHVRCRTVIAPNFDKEDEALGIVSDISTGSRAAREESGKIVYVPSDITYKEWYNGYVEPNMLTLDERRALNRYISSDSYKLNDKLRNSQDLTDDDKLFIEDLDRALDKRPNYKGDLTRSLDFTSTDELEKFVDLHKLGSTVSYPAYTSMTASSIYNPDGQVQLNISKSKLGKDIRMFNESETEVLYKRNTKFEVIDISKDDDSYFIELRELNE